MFSSEQLRAIDLIAEGGQTNLEISNIIGVHEQTIYNWKRQKDFCEAVIVRSQELYRNSQVDVTKALLKKAKAGDPACLRIYYDHLELVEKMRGVTADLNVSFSWNIPNIVSETIEASGCIES